MCSEPCGPVGYFRSATKRMIMFNRMNLFYLFYLFVELCARSARVQRSAKGLNSKMQSGFKILTVDSISSPCQAYQNPVFCVVVALRCCHASIYHVKMMKRTLTSDEHMTYDCSDRELHISKVEWSLSAQPVMHLTSTPKHRRPAISTGTLPSSSEGQWCSSSQADLDFRSPWKRFQKMRFPKMSFQFFR